MRRDGGRASPRRHICPRPRRPRADRVAQRGRHASRSGRRRRRRGRRRRRFARVSPIVHSALRLDDVARESTRRAPERIRGESLQHGLVDASRFAPASRRAPFPVARRSSPPFSAFRARRLLRSARSTPLPPPRSAQTFRSGPERPRARPSPPRRALARTPHPRVSTSATTRASRSRTSRRSWMRFARNWSPRRTRSLARRATERPRAKTRASRGRPSHERGCEPQRRDDQRHARRPRVFLARGTVVAANERDRDGAPEAPRGRPR